MHYRKYTLDELYAALDAAQTLHGIIHDNMVADTNTEIYWRFIGDLECQMADMQDDIIRRVMPAERIQIRVEVEAA
jgi:hypothetical protein